MAPWPPASAGRLQQRQSQLAKSKQPQKHKTVSPAVFRVYTWRGGYLPRTPCCALRFHSDGSPCGSDPQGPWGETAWESGEAAGSASSFCHFCFGVGSLCLNLIKNHGGRSGGVAGCWTWLLAWLYPCLILTCPPCFTSSLLSNCISCFFPLLSPTLHLLHARLSVFSTISRLFCFHAAGWCRGKPLCFLIRLIGCW